ncbi:DUF547 domain-containing protein [Simiduia aestuariiviva]|uniref:DUF547 domain-containing protein n=1 Tax=Simiduia aestuariiviva TaxID=1510459 RepID=A0A839UPN5_9GAMM|nr:DUF547 domain-containing protein [Simiduia aestuariiviva]MBB3168480.1 hypothetical protein [Simiduia aestuariiviva]
MMGLEQRFYVSEACRASQSYWRRVLPLWGIIFALYLGPACAQDEPGEGYRLFLDNYRLDSARGALVDYRAVTPAHKETLQHYVRFLEAQRPTEMTPSEAMAFWVNLYNSRMILLVLDAGVPESVKDIKPNMRAWLAGGPWKLPVAEVEGRTLSFDDIEHGILRKQWREPRIHFVLNCASLGCPDLPPRPLKAEQLAEQLEQAAHQFINSSKGVQQVNGAWQLSRIFDWFGEDFGASEAERLAFINGYRDQPIQLDATLHYRYDWALNAPQAAR